MRIAFFGSSLLSSYWNGAATYYRGIIAALDALGFRTTFFEPDAFGRQQHRDIAPPEWARVVVFPATPQGAKSAIDAAFEADVVVKASGIGVLDAEIMAAVVGRHAPGTLKIFWDVDAPATLAEIERLPRHPMRTFVPRLDAVLTYGGGAPVVRRYEALGARVCVPIYNALDPSTHFPVSPEPRFEADLAFLGNRLPDRDQRVRDFFLAPAAVLSERSFLLAGAGWEDVALPANVRAIGHLPTALHNAFNCSPLAVANIARDDMAAIGYSPATRVFEAAGAGACIVTDAWQGIGQFFEPEEEILVVQDGAEMVREICELTRERARAVGARAWSRVLREHTYDVRARVVADVLASLVAARQRSVPA